MMLTNASGSQSSRTPTSILMHVPAAGSRPRRQRPRTSPVPGVDHHPDRLGVRRACPARRPGRGGALRGC
jgi:hypothetical protein